MQISQRLCKSSHSCIQSLQAIWILAKLKMSVLMPSSINRRRDNQAQENEFESELEIEVIVVTEVEIIVIIRTRRYYIDEADDYIKKRIKSWSRSNFKNENLWEQFRHDFVDWNEERFRLTTLEAERKLRK